MPADLFVSKLCGSLPGAEASDPWGGGHEVWKVGGKMFAATGAASDGVSVKTDSVEMAQMLVEAGVGERAPYLHKSWVRLKPEAPQEEVRHRILVSYRLIREALPKKVRAGLAEIET